MCVATYGSDCQIRINDPCLYLTFSCLSTICRLLPTSLGSLLTHTIVPKSSYKLMENAPRVPKSCTFPPGPGVTALHRGASESRARLPSGLGQHSVFLSTICWHYGHRPGPLHLSTRGPAPPAAALLRRITESFRLEKVLWDLQPLPTPLCPLTISPVPHPRQPQGSHHSPGSPVLPQHCSFGEGTFPNCLTLLCWWNYVLYPGVTPVCKTPLGISVLL